MESQSTSSTVSRAAATGRGLRIALWSAQIVLAIVFALAGGMKVSTPAAELAKMAPGFPLALLRFIGIAELAGAIGLILPALTRIAPVLTPLASSGFVIVMASAAVLHLVRGELGELAVVVVLGAACTSTKAGSREHGGRPSRVPRHRTVQLRGFGVESGASG